MPLTYRYEIDSAMVDGAPVDLKELASDLQHELPWFNVVAVVDAVNDADLCQRFAHDIEQAWKAVCL